MRRLCKYRKTGKKIPLKELLFEPEYNIEQVIIKNEKEIEQKRRVELLLKDLPVKQKEVIYLRFNESMEYSDIAKVMNISVESVRNQV